MHPFVFRALKWTWHFLVAVNIIIIACGSTSVVAATPAEKPLAQYSISSWRTDDGLPQNEVHDVAQSPDGYIWVATAEGLARFDGVQFTTFTPSDSPGLATINPERLFVDGEGNLWITGSGTITRYR